MILREMRDLPPVPIEACAPTLAVSLLIPARNAGPELRDTVRNACDYLRTQFGESFEVILIPNPGDGAQARADQSLAHSEVLTREFPEVRVVPHLGTAGKGAALRTGFLKSRGRLIFFTDADLPYELSFFTRATELLRDGRDFVTGNRRLPQSQFEVPVTLLRLAYGRHRLGLWFNQLVRFFLPIQSSDTQAGIKAMTREFALRAFERQRCPGFFFDIEFFLTCAAQGFRHADLTVELYLRSEKSTVRILRQSVLAGYWLARIIGRHLCGAYGNGRNTRTSLLDRYRHASKGARVFLWIRWHLTPYRHMASFLPREGRILDLGCGHGLLSLWSALDAPKRELLGVDHDEKRIGLARSTIGELTNLNYRTGTLLPMPEETGFSGLTLIDVCHYFTPSQQEQLARGAYERLRDGGVLLVREVDPEPKGMAAFAAHWNRLYEKIATSVGFTQSAQETLHFRTRKGWEELFRASGFQVDSESCGSRIFSDVLYVCRKPRRQA